MDLRKPSGRDSLICGEGGLDVFRLVPGLAPFRYGRGRWAHGVGGAAAGHRAAIAGPIGVASRVHAAIACGDELAIAAAFRTEAYLDNQWASGGGSRAVVCADL